MGAISSIDLSRVLFAMVRVRFEKTYFLVILSTFLSLKPKPMTESFSSLSVKLMECFLVSFEESIFMIFAKSTGVPS